MVVPIILRNVLTCAPMGTRLFLELARLLLLLCLFNVVHRWFVASFGGQEAAIGLPRGFIR